MQFTETLDKIRNVSIYGLGEDIYADEVDFTIEWKVGFNTKGWGIKDLNTFIVNIIGTYSTVDWSTEEVTEHTFDFSEYKENAKINVAFTELGSLMVTNLEFDVQAKTLEVS